MPVCSRPTCNRFFDEETRAFRGELVYVRSCLACRAIRAKYMRKYRATEEGRAKKLLQNMSVAANECYQRYNASDKGKLRTLRQGEKRMRQTQEREVMGNKASHVCAAEHTD